MKKTIVFSFLFFVLGFFTHALLLPDMFSNGIMDVKNIVIPNPPPAAGTQNIPLITKITFDGKFSRHNITIEKTRYLHIINTHKTKQMELIGTTKALTTQRGYGETEALQIQFNDPGQFAVADKNNPQEKLIITVK